MRHQQPQPRILVTDACRGAAVATIRSLSRAGYYVIAADSDSHSPGLASRHANDKIIYTCPKSDHRQFAQDILKTVQDLRVDMIVPVTEQAALPLETIRRQIEGICKMPWTASESLSVVRNKEATFQLAEKLNVPYPRTRLVHSVQEAVEAASSIGWPVVLKPSSSHTLTAEDTVRVWSVDYAHNEDDLRKRMQAFEGQCAVLLQEYFAGTGVGVELLLYRGQPLCAFQHRRLREVPITGGASSLRRSDPLHPVLLDHACKLLRSLNWTGLAMVEFKQNETGEARLMEINGRMWGSLPVAVAAGVNFPVRLCQLYLDGPPRIFPTLDSDYRLNVHVQNLQKELSWIVRVIRGGKVHPRMTRPRKIDALRVCFDLLRPSYRFDILSIRDPLPGLRLITNFVRSAWRRIGRSNGAKTLAPSDNRQESIEATNSEKRQGLIQTSKQIEVSR